MGNYIPGYRHDIFISYAHIDNTVVSPQEPPGWVGTIRDNLQVCLERDLGTRDFDLWMDDKLEAIEKIETQLKDIVDNTAVLLVVLSQASANSIWCSMERKTFIEKITNLPGPRLFVIEPKPFENPDEVIEQGFDDRKKFEFWIHDENRKPRALGPPVWRDQQTFYDRCEDLGTELAKALRILKETQDRQAETVTHIPLPDEDDPVVYLADVTPDLQQSRMGVKRYLEQHDIDVLPRGHYSTDLEKYRASAQKDLARSDLFVQLLSERASVEPDGVEGGYNKLQHDLAVEAGLKMLQWRSPSIDLDAIEDIDHLDLIDSGEVRAEALEDFKEHIVESTGEAEKSSNGNSEAARVFIYADPAEDTDQETATRIAAALSEAGAECILPSISDDPGEFRKSIEQSMLQCDGLIVVHNEAPLTWVQNQLRQGRRARLRRKQQQDLGRLDWAVYEAQPDADRSGLAEFKDLKFIRDDNVEGSTPLTEFVRGLGQ